MQSQHVITLNGSVRIKTCDLELPQIQSSSAVAAVAGGATAATAASTAATSTTNVSTSGNALTAQQRSHAGSSDTNDCGRAVDNQYSFV